MEVQQSLMSQPVLRAGLCQHQHQHQHEHEHHSIRSLCADDPSTYNIPV